MQVIRNLCKCHRCDGMQAGETIDFPSFTTGADRPTNRTNPGALALEKAINVRSTCYIYTPAYSEEAGLEWAVIGSVLTSFPYTDLPSSASASVLTVSQAVSCCGVNGDLFGLVL